MNILMVHPHDIHSSAEPWAVRIVYIAREFIKRGHNVRLVYFPLIWNNQKSSELEKDIVTIPLSRRLGPHILIFNILKLYSLAKRADIIHLQKCFYHAAIPAIIAAFFRRKPLHYDWDDWELKIYEVSTQTSPLRNFIWLFLYILENVIPKVVDTVSVASNRLRVECEKLGIDKDRIFEAHVGADIIKFHPDISGENIRKRYEIDRPLVLYLGQLHGGQYVELFIETAAKLINDYKKDLSFMIVGDGYRAGELKKLVLKYNLDGKVIFTGAVSHDLVPQYIAAADVCVACFQENAVTLCKSPLKIVEYMASGKAIVASDVGEVSKMIGDAGILVASGDAQALAAGIIKVLQDNNLRSSLGRLARKRAEKEYNWTVTAKNLLDAYKKASRCGNNRSIKRRWGMFKSEDINEESLKYSNEGIAYLKKGDYKAAIKIFEKIIEIDPDNLSAYINAANCCINTGDFNKAKKYAEESVKLSSDSSYARFNLAIANDNLKEYESAKNNYKAALSGCMTQKCSDDMVKIIKKRLEELK